MKEQKREMPDPEKSSRNDPPADHADVLFTMSAVAQAELDPKSGNFIRVNDQLCELTGYSREELGFRSIFDLLPEENMNPLSEAFPWIQTGEKIYFIRLINKDRALLEIELHARGFGNPTSGVSIMAVDRTARLADEIELRKARQEIETVHKIKNEFLSHVSHELRTPIGGIMGMTEVLLHRIPDEELRQFLAVIRESARSLLFIVEDILDLANMEAGRIELRTMEFDLQQELERTVSLFIDRASEKQLKLSLRLAMDIPGNVIGDPRRLSQIIRNLVENAIEHTEDGEVNVIVRTLEKEDGYARLEFAVEDTGPGIPAEDEKFLFTEFGRLKDVYTKRSREGTGLGLVISRKLVRMMEGDIRYTRKNAGGSAFTFTILLKCGHTGSEKSGDTEKASNSLSALPSLRILMAEDNLINRMFLGMMLKDAGHTIVEAENGMLAVQKVRDAFEEGNPFDLILMDVQMPEMNGMEATKAIRAMKGPAALVPIIAITAFAMKKDEDLFLEAGMDGYVTKPVDFEELADTILKLTDSEFFEEE